MAKQKGGSYWTLYSAVILVLLMPATLAGDPYSCSSSALPATSDHAGDACHQMYTILRPTLNDTSRWIEMFRAAPHTYLSPHVQSQSNSSSGAHITLLSHLNYTPSDRDQGTCGNCWAWAGIGILEIALHSQLGIKDRLSIQHVNSNYNSGNASTWSCCGGWLEDLTEFYNRDRIVIPWSNTNAQWQDGLMTCGTKSSIAPQSISANPHYDLISMRAVTIPTWGIEKEEAIANIKNVLGQGKGVWFGFFLPNQSAWNKFFNFWGYQPECAVWQPEENLSCAYNFNSGGGHAVLCVGYNDEDPNNRYWIMLNSWGTTRDRPDGLFMVSMDMNYSCNYSGLGNAYYWMTLDVDFDKKSIRKTMVERRLAEAKAEAIRKIEDAREVVAETKTSINAANGQ